MQEEWRSVVGFEGLYEVSSNGQVRSLRFRNKQADLLLAKPRIRKHSFNKGAHTVTLSRGGKVVRQFVSRLVLSAFAGAQPEGMEGAHLDGNLDNNSISNLAWVTHIENMGHMKTHGTRLEGERTPSAKLNAEQVKSILSMRDSGLSRTAISKNYPVSLSTICRICKGDYWRSIQP